MTMTAFLLPSARRPRGAVKVNGVLIPGWLDLEVDNNNFFSADTFRCTFSGARLPSDRNAAWFSQQQDMFVELFIGFPQNPAAFTPDDLKSWIYGQVDHITVDPVTNLVEVDGRDLTRVFIDTKTTQKWPNQTASQIATALAQKHGLTASVQATTTKVGKYYEIDHVNMADERSEWDILNYLADLEGFRVWVRGQTLYFQPPPTVKVADTTALQAQLADVKTQLDLAQDQELALLSQSTQLLKQGNAAGAQALTPQIDAADSRAKALLAQYKSLQAQIALASSQSGAYPIVYQVVQTAGGAPRANFENLKMKRALTVSRGIQVKIRSWNKKYAKGFVVSYPSNVKTIKVGSSTIGTGAQIYSKTIPNLTQDQALQRAQQWYQQLVAHEMRLESLELPGDNDLDITSIIQFSGTGTAFDQQYFPDSIHRSLNFEGGYSMTVNAKNHSPESEIATI